jgi:sodium/bile acid cotransporter 7
MKETTKLLVNNDEKKTRLEFDRSSDKPAVATAAAAREATSDQTWFQKVYSKYDFPIHIVLAIFLAYLWPRLGAVILHPDITASILAVILIFVIVGLGLKTSALATACFQRIWFNLFVQLYNFFFVSSAVYVTCRFLASPKIHLLNEALASGMVICGSLPMAINVLIVLTASAGGDEAVAVFNTVFSNVVGIFLSPLLILFYLGRSANGDAGGGGLLDVRSIFANLFRIVVIPMLFGWFLHNYVPAAYNFYTRNRRPFKKTQESCLVLIVYCTFCKKWFVTSDGSAQAASVVGLSDVAFMMFLEVVLMASLSGIAWIALGCLFAGQPELRVTGLFACHHKTVALGVPLIGSLYKGHPDLALYTLAILVWHPLQLVAGSFLVPALSSVIRRERQRIDGSDAGGKVLDKGGSGDDGGTEAMGLMLSDDAPHAATRPYGSIHHGTSV